MFSCSRNCCNVVLHEFSLVCLCSLFTALAAHLEVLSLIIQSFLFSGSSD